MGTLRTPPRAVAVAGRGLARGGGADDEQLHAVVPGKNAHAELA